MEGAERFCRFCGRELPEDARYCPACGRALAAASGPEPDQPGHKTFSFPDNTTFDRVSTAVNEWLQGQEIDILEARFELDAVMLVGAMVPTVRALEIDFRPSPGSTPYQLGIMMDSRTDFGLARKKAQQAVRRQLDTWRGEHPEREVAGQQEQKLTIGWSNAWVTCFLYR